MLATSAPVSPRLGTVPPEMWAAGPDRYQLQAALGSKLNDSSSPSASAIIDIDGDRMDEDDEDVAQELIDTEMDRGMVRESGMAFGSGSSSEGGHGSGTDSLLTVTAPKRELELEFVSSGLWLVDADVAAADSGFVGEDNIDDDEDPFCVCLFSC